MTKSKKNKKRIKLDFIFTVLAVLASFYLIYSVLLFTGIEDAIRYIIVGFILLIDFVIIFRTLRRKKRRLKLPFKVIKISLLTIYAIASIFLAYNISNIYEQLNDLNKDISKSTSLVTLASNKIDKPDNIKDSKIGIINMEDDVQAYQLPKEIIDEYKLDKDNEIVSYELYTEMIKELRDEEVDYIFLPTNYIDIYSEAEGYETIGDETKIVVTMTRAVSKEDSELLSTSKKLTEPFTVLLLGIDSTQENLKNADSFNGDSIMLITFNPITLSATIVSVPRDSYVPISCFTGRVENKITHAASYGTKCVIDTIENFLNVDIDYYVKINFTGLVDLVDAVGGIEVDVPYAFCEQDSKRRFGKHTLFIEKGVQKLNGEEALALSRNRKQHADICKNSKYTKGGRSDFVRGANQQLVVQGIVNQIKEIRSVDQANDILSSLTKNIDTNMKINTILSFYDVLKDIVIKTNEDDSVFNIQRLQLLGTTQDIHDERIGKKLSDVILNKHSIKDVTNAMKENLGLKKASITKSFTYENGENYQVKIIGRGPYNGGSGTYLLLPDFTKMTRNEAENWANSWGITLVWEEVETTVTESDVILSQDYPVAKRVDLITNKTVTLKVSKQIIIEEEPEEDTDDDNLDEDTDDENQSEDEDDNNQEDEKDDGKDENKGDSEDETKKPPKKSPTQ